MPVSFHILPARGLVYVRYVGFARLEETMMAFGQYMQDPRARPGQKHLVDLTDVSGMEHDPTGIMAMQARKADHFAGTGEQTLIVYLAPTRIGFDLARMAAKSWEGLNMVIPLVQQDETQALALLGQPETHVAQLLETTPRGDPGR